MGSVSWVGRAVLPAALLLALMPALPARAGLIDFEGEPATSLPRLGAHTSLSLSDSGVTMTITRPGSAFDIVDNVGAQAGKPVGWGRRTLDPFFDAGLPAHPFILDFDVELVALSIEAGDYGADTDRIVITAFSGLGGTGAQIDNDIAAYATSGFPTIATLSVAGAGIRSVVLEDFGVDVQQSQFPDSIFWDNVRFTARQQPIPEPGTLALLAGGLVVLRRRRRAA